MGYAKFWGGVGIAILSLLFTFVIDRVFEDNSKPNTATETLLEISVWLTLWALVLTAFMCFGLGFTFWRLYRRDDAALTNIEQGTQEATS